MGMLTMRTSGSLTLVPALGTLFLLSCSCVQLQHDIFCIILLYFTFVMVGCYCLEACSFLMKDRKGLDLEGSWDLGGNGRIWGRWTYNQDMRKYERKGGREGERERKERSLKEKVFVWGHVTCLWQSLDRNQSAQLWIMNVLQALP